MPIFSGKFIILIKTLAENFLYEWDFYSKSSFHMEKQLINDFQNHSLYPLLIDPRDWPHSMRYKK